MKSLIKSIIPVLVFAIFIVGVSRTYGQSKNDSELKINDVIKLGEQFQAAMKDINSLSKKPLESEAEITEAVKTLDRHKDILAKGGYASLFILAASDSAFIADIEAKVNEVGEKKYLEMLKSNPKMALEFKNAKKIQSDMKKQLSQYVKDFKTLGTKLKTAGEKYKDQTNSSFYYMNLVNLPNQPLYTSNVSYKLNPNFDTNYIIGEALDNQTNTTKYVKYRKSLDITKVITAAKSTILVLIREVTDIVGDFEPAEDGGPSDNEICLAEALDKLTTCLARANQRKGFNRMISRANCWAVFVIENHICVFLPQSYS